MVSFKLKLVVYFLLLSLLPFSAAFIGFTAVARDREAMLVDARLQAGARAALAAYREEVARAVEAAEELAESPALAQAISDGDYTGLLALVLQESPDLRFEPAPEDESPPPLGVLERRVKVQTRQGVPLGSVVATIRLDDVAVRVRDRSGLTAGDRIVLARGGRIVGPRSVTGRLRVGHERPEATTISGDRYRALARGAGDGVTLAAIAPQEAIDAARADAARRLLVAFGAVLAFVLFLAYVLGRSIVRTVVDVVDAARDIAHGRFRGRVPVRGRDELAVLATTFNDMAAQLEARLDELDAERQRLREATRRFAEALGASHDVDHLLRAIVETAVEATAAEGGVVRGPGGVLARAGRAFDDSDAAVHKVGWPLNAGDESFGTLILHGPKFDIRDLETASTLVRHAIVALDNARLHRIVERQAQLDGLTGLANRREAESALAGELHRAERLGESVALVLADLDNFKSVNDRYGHPVGDAVICEFAQVLHETVRDIDVAARWGGEEFALILPGTDTAGAMAVAERIRKRLAVRTILTPEAERLAITASFGVAAYPAAAADALVAQADEALYEAKRTGKDRVVGAADAAPVA